MSPSGDMCSGPCRSGTCSDVASQKRLLELSWPGQHCGQCSHVTWAALWAVQQCGPGITLGSAAQWPGHRGVAAEFARVFADLAALCACQHCCLGSTVGSAALSPAASGQCSTVARAALWAVQHCGPGSADSQESLLVFSWPGQHCVHANTVAWAASWAVQLCCLPKVCQSV